MRSTRPRSTCRIRARGRVPRRENGLHDRLPCETCSSCRCARAHLEYSPIAQLREGRPHPASARRPGPPRGGRGSAAYSERRVRLSSMQLCQLGQRASRSGGRTSGGRVQREGRLHPRALARSTRSHTPGWSFDLRSSPYSAHRACLRTRALALGVAGSGSASSPHFISPSPSRSVLHSRRSRRPLNAARYYCARPGRARGWVRRRWQGAGPSGRQLASHQQRWATLGRD